MKKNLIISSLIVIVAILAVLIVLLLTRLQSNPSTSDNVQTPPENIPIEAQQALYTYISGTEQLPNYNIISAMHATNPLALIALTNLAPDEGWCIVIDRTVPVIDTISREMLSAKRFRAVRTGVSWSVEYSDGTTDPAGAQQRWEQAGCSNWNNSSIMISSATIASSMVISTADPTIATVLAKLIGNYYLNSTSGLGTVTFAVEFYDDGRLRAAGVVQRGIGNPPEEGAAEFGTYTILSPDRIIIELPSGERTFLPGTYRMIFGNDPTQALDNLERQGSGRSFSVSPRQ